MRLVSVSDIHGDPRAGPFINGVTEELSPDLLIISGDITTFGPGIFAEKLLTMLETRCAAIPGNCDPDEVLQAIERNCISLHRKRERIDGIDFVGLGGSPKSPFSTPRELDDADIKKILDSVMVKECVLVTHAPPLGINDLLPSGARLGSSVVAKFVKKYRPILVLSGHVHEARGLVEQEGTIFANPGPMKGGHIVLVELGDKISAELIDFSSELQKL